MSDYNPRAWFWIVGGDTSRFWSSADAAYVTGLSPGTEATHIASETELDDVLAVYGMLGPTAKIVSRLSSGMLARFTATAPVSMLENIGLAGVTRVAKGRYRVILATPMPSDSYSAIPGVFDVNVRSIRVTARTSTFVEVRIVDQAGAAADATEATVKIERVTT